MTRRTLIGARLVFVLIAASVATAASAQERLQWPLHLAIGAGIVLQGIDGFQTMYLSGAGQARELNPVFAPFFNKPIAAGAFKMTLATGSAQTLRVVHPKRPWTSLLVALAEDAFYIGVITHNAHVTRDARSR